MFNPMPRPLIGMPPSRGFKERHQRIMLQYSISLQPNPQKPSEAPKAYAKVQFSEVVELEDFVKHIASHNTVYSEGVIVGVFTEMVGCLREHLVNGKKVKLGPLGDFSPSLSSRGAASPEDFSASYITAVNVNFQPGNRLTNLIADAHFELVSSRIAQAATLKAEKSGQSTVDLAAAKEAAKKNGSDTESGSTGNDNTNDNQNQNTGGTGTNGNDDPNQNGGGSNTGGNGGSDGDDPDSGME